MRRLILVLMLCLSVIAIAQPNLPRPQGGGPVNHQIMSASSPDGLNWTFDNKVLIQHASVPAAIVTKEGNIRLYYVDASNIPENVNCAESTDGGNSFRVLGCTIENRSLVKALDPSIVRLPDGRYRLYYFCSSQHINPNETHSIYSAISNDGVHFVQEQEVFNQKGAVDPDVFYNGNEWLMYVFTQGTIIAKSADGLSFTYLQHMQPPRYGTTAPVKLADGRFRLYAFNQPQASMIVSFISNDGINWTKEDGVRLTAPQGKQITDPFVVQLPNGSWKMFYKFEMN